MENTNNPQNGTPDAPDKEKMEQVSFQTGKLRQTAIDSLFDYRSGEDALRNCRARHPPSQSSL